MPDPISTAFWWLSVSACRVKHLLRQELLAAKLLVHVVSSDQWLQVREKLLITQTRRHLQFVHDLDASQLVIIGMRRSCSLAERCVFAVTTLPSCICVAFHRAWVKNVSSIHRVARQVLASSSMRITSFLVAMIHVALSERCILVIVDRISFVHDLKELGRSLLFSLLRGVHPQVNLRCVLSDEFCTFLLTLLDLLEVDLERSQGTSIVAVSALCHLLDTLEQ